MEMRIVAPDDASAAALAEQLAITLGSDRILLREQRAVDVLIDLDPDPAIVRVVDTVEQWFEQARVATVEMWLGKRSYEFARWVPARPGLDG